MQGPYELCLLVHSQGTSKNRTSDVQYHLWVMIQNCTTKKSKLYLKNMLQVHFLYDKWYKRSKTSEL